MLHTFGMAFKPIFHEGEMVRDKQGVFQLSKKGFWKVYQFSLVELRSCVSVLCVFGGKRHEVI